MLCDHAWLDPDMDSANGVLMDKEADMLRMDAMLLVVQLNIRQLMEVAPFNIPI